MADIQEQIGERAQAAAEPRIVVCQYGGTPHPIDDECADVKDVGRGSILVVTRRCAHAPIHEHDDGACLLAPAAEPQPDVLDLVRQYGLRRAGEVAGRGEVAAHLRSEHEALLARITAEVERLRDERDDYAARLKATDRSWAKVAEAVVEVERLKAKVREETELQDEYAAWADRLANAAIERLNLPITEEAHTELWEAALAGLKDPAPAGPGRTEQALTSEGVPLWLHVCGNVLAANRTPVGPDTCGVCYDHRPWRLLLVAAPQQDAEAPGPIACDMPKCCYGIVAHNRHDAECPTQQPKPAPQQDGPLVLSLPPVPEGTVALVGDVYRYRFLDNGNGDRYWVSPDLGPLPLGHVLDFEGSVTVEMAAPEPTLADDLAIVGHRILGAGPEREAFNRIKAALKETHG
jgi:hypothetical protein